MAAQHYVTNEGDSMTPEMGTNVPHADVRNGALAQVAATDATVLIVGERGVGHAQVARTVHHLSPRRDFPFEVVDCTLPPDRLDAELFGRDAFRDPGPIMRGKLFLADRGTIFLDEITALPSSLQGKLLQVLQDARAPVPHGGEEACVDVRVVAGTHKDFRALVEQGGFRQDLYYRLNVLRVNVRPLRQRREEIPALVTHFLTKYAARYGRLIRDLSALTMGRLVAYPWPGNLSELENLVERIVVLDSDDWVPDELHSSLEQARHMGLDTEEIKPSRGHSAKGRRGRPGRAA
jgi:DNA-binding NtrC family response regulator